LLRARQLVKRRAYRKGEYLYRQGELDSKFYLILHGRVMVSSTREDGSEFMLEIMGHYAICGEAAAIDGLPYFTSAQALDDAQVIVFDAGDVSAASRESPEIAVALLRITARKQRIIAVRAQHLASLKPEARIAELLHRMAEQHGARIEGGVELGIKLTHKQMAALTGTTRVTVTRVLKRLKAQGKIAVRANRVVVLDIDRLMQVTDRNHG
jgi:CRP-like cAMP-binding protein